jgi:hypothetical protein
MSSVEKEEKRISRRDFAKGAAVVGAGVLASCASPTPQVVKETVEVPVEVEKIVKETVEVPVEVTKIVEVPAGETGPAGPVRLEVYDPTGALNIEHLFSPRLDTLEGKTICFVGADMIWQEERTFPYLEELLKNLYPSINIIQYTEFPHGDARFPVMGGVANPDLAKLLKAAGCQGAIIGNAG